MIDLTPESLEIVRKILKEFTPSCEARVFGSRINGTSHRFSDLDIALICNKQLGWKFLESLKSVFSESNLPIIVDIHD